jgi:uncharacterized repeat protein (TIGR01451 family)
MDSLLGDLSSQITGGVITLAEGSETVTGLYTVTLAGPDPLPNTVTVKGENQFKANPVSATASHKVDILYTGVSIAKTGPATAEVGETITYTITVTNTGEVDLYITSLMDTLLGDLSSQITGGVITLAEGSETFTYTYKVLASDSDPLLNTITVKGVNQFKANPVSDSDGHSVNLLNTGVSITKSGPTSAEVGETITYTIIVTNTGEVDLHITTLSDTLLGDLKSLISGGVITVAEGSETLTVTYTVLQTDADPLPNTVTVKGENQYGEDPVSDVDSHKVDIKYTGVTIAKSGPATAEVGETITYTFKVTNTGEVDLHIAGLSDTLLGDLSGYISGGVITVAEGSETFTVTYLVTSSPDPLPNTVFVKGKNQYGADPVGDSDKHAVDILYTGVSISKTGAATAEVGETITYTIKVTNTGEVDLYITSLMDTVMGDLSSYISGGVITLAEGSETFTYTHTVLITDPDVMPNTITVKGENQFKADPVSDSDLHRVDILYTGVSIEKIGPKTAEVGENITYTIKVTNTGEVDLYITSLTDTLLGDLSSYISGGVITLTEGSETFTVTYPVTASPDPLPNTATVKGVNQFKANPVSDTDTHYVDLLYTGVSVTKTGPKTAEVGETVTYSVTVTNTGEVDLYITSLMDSLVGDVSGYISGGVITLAEGSETFTYTYTVQQTDADPLPNTVTVSGENQFGADPVSDSDRHTVDIKYTGVTIKKTGPATAEVGETITYTIKVTNTGDVDLYISSLTDTILGDLTSQITGGVITLAEVSETFTYTHTVLQTDSDPLYNKITVIGENQFGADEVTDSDDQRVDIKYTDVSIVKTGPTTALVGETITYTITVYNDGEVDLYIDSLYDTLLGDLSSYISDGVIKTTEVYETFTYTYTVKLSDTDPLYNNITVKGENQYGADPVSDSDDHSVDIKYTGVSITKTGPADAEVGETITYTISVTNTGEVDLYITSLYDTVLGDLSGYISGGVITTTEVSETFTVTYTVSASPDPLPNTVKVSGVNVYKADKVSDSASHEVDILRTGVSIVKSGPDYAHDGDTLTYVFNVTNTGEVDLYITFLNDTVLGDLSDHITGGVITLAEGYETFTVSYNLTMIEVNCTGDDDCTCCDDTHTGDDCEFDNSDNDNNTYLEDDDWKEFEDEDDCATPVSPTDGSTYTSPITGIKYNVENPTNNPFYSIKFETLGEGVKKGATYDSDQFEFTLEVDPDEYKIDVSAKGGLIVGTMSVSDEGDLYSDDGFTVELVSITDNNDGTYTYVLEITNYNGYGLSHVAFSLPCYDGDDGDDDDNGGDDGGNGDDDGCDNGNNTNCTHLVPTYPDPLPNVVTVNGENQFEEDPVSDSDRHVVDIIHPDIDVVKTGPARAYWGSTVTYTYTVTNPGDTPLKNVGVVDNLAGIATYVSGDTDNDGMLDPDETWIFEADYVVPVRRGDVTNIAKATGEDILGLKVSDCDRWTMKTNPKSQVTDSSLCYFDLRDDLDDRQFRLIFTPSHGIWKMFSSNPGQFYYNVFFIGTPGDDVSFDISIPYPFITKGATPIHYYSDVDYAYTGCFIPKDMQSGWTVSGTDVTHKNGNLLIDLDSHGSDGMATLTAEGTMPDTGLVYITIHLDFGLEGTRGYSQTAGDNADHTENIKDLPNFGDYKFSVGGTLAHSETIHNWNDFQL